MRAPDLPWGKGVSDPKRVIEEGYDRIARRHLEWSDLEPPRSARRAGADDAADRAMAAAGGVLAATFSSSDSEDQIEEDWLGVPMFFAGFGADANEALLRRADFELELSDVREEPEDGVPVEFHFVIACRGA
jgi:hypothetical protein